MEDAVDSIFGATTATARETGVLLMLSLLGSRKGSVIEATSVMISIDSSE
jgi:hypothetical protein